MTPLDHARDLVRRGFSVVPVPYREKGPKLTNWNRLRLAEADLPRYFNGRPSNLGILWGAASGGCVDVDLDHPLARELAAQFLPPTDCTFGREGAPASHWVYRLQSSPVRNVKIARRAEDMPEGDDEGTIVELRGDLLQTVAPGSTHKETGEAIRWDSDGEPAEVDPDDLVRAVYALANAVLAELGEPLQKCPTNERRSLVTVTSESATRTYTTRPTGVAKYVLAALDREAEAVASAAKGTRNNTLNDAAFACGQLVHAGVISEHDVEARLLDAAAACGLVADDGERAVLATIRSGLEAGKRNPRDLSGIGRGQGGGRTHDRGVGTPDGSPCDGDVPEAELLSDVGNAARLVIRCGSALRYSHQQGQWFVFDGRRWKADDRGRVVSMAKATALSILDEAKRADGSKFPALLAWAKASQKRERILAMMALAQPELAVTPGEMDADPWAFNVLNGTLDLRTGDLRPHRREDLITKLAPVEFDPEARCTRFDTFLARVFGGDTELVGFVQRWLGYCLTGDVGEQYLPIFHGEGGNGKSVLLDTVSRIMGDYAGEAPPDLLTVKKHEGHPTEIADLMGKRLVIASETERDAELKVQFVKRLTGNARLKGRFMRRDFFEFDRTHKMLLVTNNKPAIRENGEAVWRRLRLVPFGVTITSAERDPNLIGKLWEERAGILAWLVRGCVAWQRDGLSEPSAVLLATEAYRATANSLDAFISERCDVGEGLVCFSADLLRAYTDWCCNHGQVPLQTRAFGEALRSLGCTPRKLAGQRAWAGVAIRQDGMDGVGQQFPIKPLREFHRAFNGVLASIPSRELESEATTAGASISYNGTESCGERTEIPSEPAQQSDWTAGFEDLDRRETIGGAPW